MTSLAEPPTTAGPALVPSAAPLAGDGCDGDVAEVLRAHVDALYPQHARESEIREITALPGTCTLPPGTADQLHRVLVKPVRYLIEKGGRRWRPRLVASAVEALGGDSADLGPLLAAAEVMHTGSLMVDDIQDSATRRRGARAAHLEFGPATTLNAGTAAYFTLDRVLPQLSQDPRIQVAMYRSYLAALRSAHAGQGLDIAGHRAAMDAATATGDTEQLLEAVRVTHRLKSGAPVACLMDLAAHSCGTNTELRHALARYGEAIGTAYQITDDVQDLTGVVRHGMPTKLAGEDLRNGKVTMPLAHAVALLPRDKLTHLWQSIKEPGADPETVHEAIEVLTSCGALNAARKEAEHLVEQGWTPLEHLLPPSAATDQLRDLGRQTALRNHIA
ncbi:polyprenyl synthetase family protein [Streptomyces violascens]|uniref:polyprenyl synthetase family protein n=1 Tax=Streptomyces violascens TaxID=67381 RepID=UPI0036A003DF